MKIFLFLTCFSLYHLHFLIKNTPQFRIVKQLRVMFNSQERNLLGTG